MDVQKNSWRMKVPERMQTDGVEPSKPRSAQNTTKDRALDRWGSLEFSKGDPKAKTTVQGVYLGGDPKKAE